MVNMYFNTSLLKRREVSEQEAEGLAVDIPDDYSCNRAMDNFFPGEATVNSFKFGTVTALFLSTLIIRKSYREQVILSVAFFFMVAGDFFLDFCEPLPGLGVKLIPFGMLGFSISYILIIVAYRKNLSAGPGVILAAVAVLAFFIPGLLVLYPHVSRPLLPGAALFGTVLFLMAWVSLSTVFSGRYRPGVAWRIALPGLLILVSDTAVAHSLFNPAFAGQFVPWLKNIIWGTFIPAWTLIAVNIAEDRLY